ncbi:unnamed protein product [Cuscuta campestris]|uniref:DUF4283 domain-containing protein n=1 Tax=Cuscuta campestris TaxID=132261 RepID=A0A484M516_9ASTE|nr:unnamed protein product [Cuscuta campestris]
MRRRRKQLLKGGTGGLSFAQVMAPKQLLSSPFPLQVPALPDRAISTHRGIPCVRFSANEVDTLSSVDHFLIVGKFSHGQPKLELIKKHFASQFVLRGSVTIGWRGPKHIFLKFTHPQDATDILLKEQILFEGTYPMRLFRWTSDFSLETETPISPVWVLLHDLPFHYFNDKALTLICKPIGKYLGMDKATLEGIKPNHARVRVEMDLLKPLVSKVFIGTSVEEGEEDQGPASTAVPPTFQPETPSGYSSEPEGKVGFKDLDYADIVVEEKGKSEERQCSSPIIVDGVANDDKVIANSAPPISRHIDFYGEIHFYPVDEQGYIIPVTKHDEDYRSMKVLKTRALKLISNNWEADFKKVDYARHPALKEAMRWARQKILKNPPRC